MGCNGCAVGEIDPVTCKPTDTWFNSRRTVSKNERGITSLQVRKDMSKLFRPFQLTQMPSSSLQSVFGGQGGGGIKLRNRRGRCLLVCGLYPRTPMSNEQVGPTLIRSERECSLDTPFGARDHTVKRQ